MPATIESDPSKPTVTPISKTDVDERYPSNRTHKADEAAPVKDRAYYRTQIKLIWDRTVESIMSMCHLITDARSNLSRKDFDEFIKDDVKLEYSQAQKFLNMGTSERLNDPRNWGILPSSWNCLYEIMQMEPATFLAGVEQGIINRTCTLRQLRELRRRMEKPKRQASEQKAHKEAPNSPAADSEKSTVDEDASSPEHTSEDSSSAPTETQLRTPVADSTACHEVESSEPKVMLPKKLAAENCIVVSLTPLDVKDMQLASEFANEIRKLGDDYAFCSGVNLFTPKVEMSGFKKPPHSQEHPRFAESRG